MENRAQTGNSNAGPNPTSGAHGNQGYNQPQGGVTGNPGMGGQSGAMQQGGGHGGGMPGMQGGGMQGGARGPQGNMVSLLLLSCTCILLFGKVVSAVELRAIDFSI